MLKLDVNRQALKVNTQKHLTFCVEESHVQSDFFGSSRPAGVKFDPIYCSEAKYLNSFISEDCGPFVVKLSYFADPGWLFQRSGAPRRSARTIQNLRKHWNYRTYQTIRRKGYFYDGAPDDRWVISAWQDHDGQRAGEIRHPDPTYSSQGSKYKYNQ